LRLLLLALVMVFAFGSSGSGLAAEPTTYQLKFKVSDVLIKKDNFQQGLNQLQIQIKPSPGVYQNVEVTGSGTNPRYSVVSQGNGYLTLDNAVLDDYVVLTFNTFNRSLVSEIQVDSKRRNPDTGSLYSLNYSHGTYTGSSLDGFFDSFFLEIIPPIPPTPLTPIQEVLQMAVEKIRGLVYQLLPMLLWIFLLVFLCLVVIIKVFRTYSKP